MLPRELLWGSVLPAVGCTFVCVTHLIYPVPPLTKDSGKLPFMAMLRNLCNLLRTGISARHHELVLQRLQHEVSVITGGVCGWVRRPTWVFHVAEAVMATSLFLCGM